MCRCENHKWLNLLWLIVVPCQVMLSSWSSQPWLLSGWMRRSSWSPCWRSPSLFALFSSCLVPVSPTWTIMRSDAPSPLSCLTRYIYKTNMVLQAITKKNTMFFQGIWLHCMCCYSVVWWTGIIRIGFTKPNMSCKEETLENGPTITTSREAHAKKAANYPPQNNLWNSLLDIIMLHKIHSGDDIQLYFVAELPWGGLFRWRQTGPPEWYQWILGLQHRHSTLRCGGQRPPEDSGWLPEADAAQEEGKRTQEAPIIIWNGAQQQRYSVKSIKSLFSKPNSQLLGGGTSDSANSSQSCKAANAPKSQTSVKLCAGHSLH